MRQSLTELHSTLIAEHKRLSQLGDYDSHAPTIRLLLRAVAQLVTEQQAIISGLVQRDEQV